MRGLESRSLCLSLEFNKQYIAFAQFPDSVEIGDGRIRQTPVRIDANRL